MLKPVWIISLAGGLAAVIAASLFPMRHVLATISLHGWIAMGLGMVLTFGLGTGLMLLVFISSKRGYDEAPKIEDQATNGGLTKSVDE